MLCPSSVCVCWRLFELRIYCIPQRILRVEYEFPPHVRVSRECKDLLKNILVPDPASRYTVEDIQRHPWYLKDLPPGVKEMNDNLPPPAPGLQASAAPVHPRSYT
jgi:serine/threonine protein kinase